jgi:hypothetical protein
VLSLGLVTLRRARLTFATLQIDVTFKLKKLADAGDAGTAKHVDTGRKRLHCGTVRLGRSPSPSRPFCAALLTFL